MFQERRMRCWHAPACCEASRSRPVFEASFGELLDLLGLVWRSVERSLFCSGVGFLCENKWVPSTYVFVDLKTFVNLGRSFPNECIFGFCAVLSLFSWRYVGRQQASDWLWGFRIPIRELKVHYFRLDSVLGCICLLRHIYWELFGVPLPLPSTVWGGLCFTEPTRLCWASGFLAPVQVTILTPNPSGTRALVLLTAGDTLVLRFSRISNVSSHMHL